MKIIKLASSNIKKLHAVEIQPDGSLVIIGGKNDAGKSSVLDSIQMALDLAGCDIPVPIRTGAKRGEINIDLGDLKVKRTFTASGSQLVVTNKEGLVHKSPQAILDALTGKLSFDPLEFARMNNKEQLETAKELVGLDFTKDDMERKIFYDERTQVNREIKALEGRVAAIPDVEGPSEEKSVLDLTEEMDRRGQVNRSNEEKRMVLKSATKTLEIAEVALEELRERAKIAANNVLILQDKRRTMEEEIGTLSDLDTESVKEEIRTVEANNQKARDKKQRTDLKIQLKTKNTEADNLTSKMEEIDQRKAMLISAAQFPVEGMSFDENGVLYNGVPFKQEGMAGQIRVSVAMGLAMNPKLKVILIRDGSLLDADNLAMVAKMAEEAGAQIWLEKCGEGEGSTVIIADGMVKEPATNAQ